MFIYTHLYLYTSVCTVVCFDLTIQCSLKHWFIRIFFSNHYPLSNMANIIINIDGGSDSVLTKCRVIYLDDVEKENDANSIMQWNKGSSHSSLMI